MDRIKKHLFIVVIFVFILSNLLYGQNKPPFISDFRVNEQGGNSVKNTSKTAINDNNISMVVWHDYREGTSNIYAQLINANGELIGKNIKVNNTENDDEYITPDVAVNENNQFLVAWSDTRDGYKIYGQIIDEDGNFVGDNFIISDENIYAYQTQPAIASNGKEFIVAWRDGRNGSYYDIFAQKLDQEGNKIGNNFIVNADSQAVSKYSPDVAIKKDSSYIVTWYYYKNGLYTPASIVRDKNNQILSSQIEVSDSGYSSVNNYYPQTAATDSGFVIVWYRNVNNQYNIIGQLLNSKGEKIDSNFVINDADNSYCFAPTAASDSSGNFVVTWYDYRNNYAQVYAQKFINDTISGANFKISEDELTGSKSYVSCAINNNDNMISAWLDYGDPTLYRIMCRLIGSNDQPAASSIIASLDSLSSSETNPSITVMNDGSFIVVWTDTRSRTYKTYFQRYDAEGNPLGTNVSNDDNGTQFDPRLAMLKDGNFLLIWREYSRNIYNQYEVLGQKYFKTGEKIGDTFIISSINRRGDVSNPDICSNSNGDYVVTWQKRYGTIYSIAAEKFDNDGNIVKNNFLVTNDTTSYKYRPKAGIDSLGNFAITYYSYKNNNYDIFLHRYNSSGEELDSGIVVNDDKTNSTQYYPDISVNPAGDCIVAWYDYRTTNGVYFQKYKNIGSADSFEKIDSNMAVADYVISNCTPAVSLQDNGEFAISWTEWNGSVTGSFNNLKFRIYNSDLSPLTEIMDATISQVRDQINQDIVFKDNKIFNVWEDNHEPGVGYDIWANVYNFDYLVTDVNNKANNTPTIFKLSQNYPNPFNPATTIQYAVPSEMGHPDKSGQVTSSLQQVELKVFDILGREVATLVNQRQNPGQYQVTFNAGNLASGAYFYRLRVGDFVKVNKMLLLK